MGAPATATTATNYGPLLLGGGLALAGTFLSGILRMLDTRSNRSEQRAVKNGEYRLASLEQLQAAAGEYRAALIGYNRALQSEGEIPQDTEERLQTRRAMYQAVLYRVDDNVTKALQAWCEEALKWTQAEGSAQTENELWEKAMEVCGDAIKRQLR